MAQITVFQTQPCIKQQFGMAGLAFRILAPEAPQRATFEKNNGADTGAIMCGIALDIEYHFRKKSSFRFHMKI